MQSCYPLPFFSISLWCVLAWAALYSAFSFLFASFLPFFFLPKNQMGLTLKNRGTADDLRNTQKESQQSHPARVCLQTRRTILITSILGRESPVLWGGWPVAQVVILTFHTRSGPSSHMTPSKSHPCFQRRRQMRWRLQLTVNDLGPLQLYVFEVARSHGRETVKEHQSFSLWDHP